MLNTDIISNQFFGRLDRGAGMSQKVVVKSQLFGWLELKRFKTQNGALFVQDFLVAEVCENKINFLELNCKKLIIYPLDLNQIHKNKYKIPIF